MVNSVRPYATPNDGPVVDFINTVFSTFNLTDIPLFLMLGGYLFISKLNRTTDLGNTLKKRFVRLGVPTLAWSLFYFVAFIIDRRLSHQTPDYLGNLKDWACLGKPGLGFHLWYMYALFIMEPAVTLVLRTFSRVRRISVIAVVWLLLAATVMSVVLSLRGEGDARVYFIVRGLTLAPYYIFGKALGDWVIGLDESRKRRVHTCSFWIWLLTLAFGVALHLYAPQALYSKLFAQAYLNFLMPYTALNAFALFTCVMTTHWNPSEKSKMFFASAAKLTFGVYLMRIILLLTMRAIVGHVLPESSFPRNVFIGTMTYLVSFGVTWILFRFPLTKRFVA